MVEHVRPVVRPVALPARVIPAVVARVVVAALALGLYVLTLAPTVLWGGDDLARDQVWAYTLHLEGGSRGHPLWVLLAHLFTLLPFGDVAYRVTLSSAVIAALALALIFAVILDLTSSWAGAWLGTAALAVSHTFWTYAVLPKVYALNSLLLALAIFLALRWERSHRPAYLYGLAAALGLGAYSHLLFFVLAPAFVVYVLTTARRGDTAHLLGVALLYAAFAVSSLLVAGYGAEAGENATSTGADFVRQFLAVLVSPRSLLLGVGIGAALLVYQFFITLGVAAGGVREMVRGRPRVALLFVLIALLDTAFVFSWIPASARLFDYAVNWHFYLPLYQLVAILAGVGFAGLWTRLGGLAARAALGLAVVALPVAVYAAAPRVARHALARLEVRSLPGRDNATYLLSPWKQNEGGARMFGERVMSSLPPHATLLADYSIYWVVRYIHDVDRRRPDVRLVELPPPPNLAPQAPLALRESARGRPLFIPDTNRYYDMADLQRAFRIVRSGSVYRLVR